MKLFIALLLTGFGISAHAAIEGTDKCKLGLAKKFADGIIAVDVKENKYRPGRLIFERRNSHEYTPEWLKEQIGFCGEGSACAKKYSAILQEIEANSNLHVYSLQYQWKADDNINLGFYYTVRTKNYGRGCALESLTQD